MRTAPGVGGDGMYWEVAKVKAESNAESRESSGQWVPGRQS